MKCYVGYGGKLHSSLLLALGEDNGQFHCLFSLIPGTKCPVPIKLEAGFPQSLWEKIKTERLCT
jgi:hypothetical protein